MAIPNNQDERAALFALLKSHPAYGRRALSINDCLRCRTIPASIKAAYETIYQQRYAKGGAQ